MIIGLFFGAWMYQRGGWWGISVTAVTWMTLSILEAAFGWQAGETLARATLQLFGYEATP